MFFLQIKGKQKQKLKEMIIIVDFTNIYTKVIIRQWPGKPGFNPRSRHTKDLKMLYLQIKGKQNQKLKEMIIIVDFTNIYTKVIICQ